MSDMATSGHINCTSSAVVMCIYLLNNLLSEEEVTTEDRAGEMEEAIVQ